jgi:putative membrane protein
MKENKVDLYIFLKGMLMGICDLIPGISGGTIAFITGIYERLIVAVKNFSGKNIFILIQLLFKFKFSKFYDKLKSMDFFFLLVLVLGILSAILAGSKLVNYLLEFYFSYLMAFFLGLIVASLKIIYSHIDNHNFYDRVFIIIGFIFGFSLRVLSSSQLENPNLIYVFFGGFVAISAMFLR